MSLLIKVLKHRGVALNSYNGYRRLASSTDIVSVEFDQVEGKSTGVVILKFNNPSTLNALTVDMGTVFEAKVAELRQLDSKQLRCVVLTGEGKAFSAGGDLQFLLARANDTPIVNSQVMRDFYKRFLSLRTLPVPVVAAVNGPAIGAGFAVSLACDMRVIAADAKVGLTFATLGLHPGMGSTHYLPSLVGIEKAARLLLTGAIIEGTEAGQLGICSSVVLKDQVVPQALKLAREIASASPVAVRSTTVSLRMKQDVGLEQALQREADCQAHSYNMPDLKEGLEAVKAKRKPIF